MVACVATFEYFGGDIIGAGMDVDVDADTGVVCGIVVEVGAGVFEDASADTCVVVVVDVDVAVSVVSGADAGAGMGVVGDRSVGVTSGRGGDGDVGAVMCVGVDVYVRVGVVPLMPGALPSALPEPWESELPQSRAVPFLSSPDSLALLAVCL